MDKVFIVAYISRRCCAGRRTLAWRLVRGRRQAGRRDGAVVNFSMSPKWAAVQREVGKGKLFNFS